MFGSKLRSWMEAVRPRKKQQRKEKQLQLLQQQQQQKMLVANANGEFVAKFKTVQHSQSSENEMMSMDSKSMQTIASQPGARYSGANLSSPESAYSTGYSTDGTSPGAPPPEYYINIRTGTRYFPEAEKCTTTTITPATTITSPTAVATQGNHLEVRPKPLPPATALAKRPLPPVGGNLSPSTRRANNIPLPLPPPPPQPSATTDYDRRSPALSMGHEYDTIGKSTSTPRHQVQQQHHTSAVVVMSPRQRNRIRTNPWAGPNPAAATLSPCASSVHTPRASLMNSPVPHRYLSPTIARAPRCASLSSSSCSSLSAASLNWDVNLIRDTSSTAVKPSPRFLQSASEEDEEEDDCTLNEMMGKYDESYVYEKETDILSDSDPTDCEETDIDTGQDGGDEDDQELDFIDNGSLLEFSIKDERANTGHCTYYNFEMQRKASASCGSRNKRSNLRRSRKDSNSTRTRRRSKPKQKAGETSKPLVVQQRQQPHHHHHYHEGGTRSAGATPLSVRRNTKLPISKLALDDGVVVVRKRSSSVSIPRGADAFFDQRDKEAAKKYKELIVEAEHILKNMKSQQVNGLSPRRVPGPANKRVELLRTESSSVAVKPPDEPPQPILPSTFSPRFSPKRNHITKFISSNSPIMLRREDSTAVSPAPKKFESPLVGRRHSPKTDLPSRRSPKYRKKQLTAKRDSFSSDSESETTTTTATMTKSVMLRFDAACPQSEPVKRKIYSNQCNSKTVAFNNGLATHTEISMSFEEAGHRKSCESLRQQVLLNTITNLKRSLEDQSASLKQVYCVGSTQNLQT